MAKHLFHFIGVYILLLTNTNCLIGQNSSSNSLANPNYNNNWTTHQIETANTADTLNFLTKVEKETILDLIISKLFRI